MSKIIKQSILYSLGITALILIYLSVVGIETDKFNNQIRDKVAQKNGKINLELKKIKLTLDPLKFRINAKTISPKIIYQKKIIELEYIKTQISLISLIKNKIISSNLEISSRSIFLKDLVTFVRTINNKPELFFLEHLIKNGNVTVNIKLNIDENGNIKKDYEINGILKNGKINFSNKYNFKKINLNFDFKENILNFQDIDFRTNKIDFFSKKLKVTQNKKNFIFVGIIENKKTILNNNILNLIKSNFQNLNFRNISFNSKNNFSFKIDEKYKFKDLIITSEIQVDELKYVKPDLFKDYFADVEDIIHLKDHKIEAKYKENNFTIGGLGKIKLHNRLNEIEYLITNKNNNLNIISNLSLIELNIKNLKFLKIFFPELNKTINLKDNKVKINYNKKNLSFSGFGKIQLEKEFELINYSFSKNGNELNFDTKLHLDKTSLNISYLNYKKDKEVKTKLTLAGSYKKNNELNLNKVSIISKNNKITLTNFLLDKEYKIVKIDEVDLDYLDNENKRNQVFIQRIKKNNYKLNSQSFNANNLISNLLESNNNKKSQIFKDDINLILNLTKVYIDDKNLVKNLKGNLIIKNNKVFKTNISSLFDNNENLSFTINTNDNGEKITTLFSSRAKPLVKRYQFIKGYEEGYLDFYSSKIGEISSSKLKIYDFKLQELPVLTKLLTLASLQGIADILSGEGIRFDEFEMNFKNKGNLMTIDEIYAIGPAISILMSGYVEKDKLISLRGTLVPATTINKTIGSIPVLGKILVGNKTGEGVFGVSFKIKGPPKNLESTVNPIKTLTPRFITRTLEKIKKN